MKRLFDIVASGLATVILSPLLVPLIVLLRLSGEGKIFYAQERVGRGGRPFAILKFATMLENSPNLPGGDITVDKDPRILPMGHFLRATKINELPQLFNVLRGDMSLIGPRPMTARVITLFPPSYASVIASLRPGLSGIGSIVFRDEEALLRGVTDRERVYGEIIAPYKVALETWYKARAGLGLDLKLIFLTLAVVVRPNIQVARHLKDLPPPPPAIQRLRQQAGLSAA